MKQNAAYPHNGILHKHKNEQGTDLENNVAEAENN